MGLERAGLLLLLPIVLAVFFLRRGGPLLPFPSLAAVPEGLGGRIFFLVYRAVPPLLLLLLAFLAAGMRFSLKDSTLYGYGADIVFLLDESGSMVEKFGHPNLPTAPGAESGKGPSKFEAAKSVVSKFIEKRKPGRDRYGLTVFGTSAVRVLPLSFNRRLFLDCLAAQESILSSTVFSAPIAFGLEELIHSKARSRVIVFVSDGGGILENQRYGFSEFIRKHGIRFYWISLGEDMLGTMEAFMNQIGPLGRRMDIRNESQLQAGFAEIDRLERSLVAYRSSVPAFSSRPLIYAALVLMALLWVGDVLLIYDRRR